MQKFKITLEAEITIEFDENSEEFKEMWDGYTQAIDRGANYESFAETIASQISRYGLQQHIEGVGYVQDNGDNQHVFANGDYEEQESCVNAIVSTDLNRMVEFDVTHTQNLMEEN